jgi:hypothetical protein
MIMELKLVGSKKKMSMLLLGKFSTLICAIGFNHANLVTFYTMSSRYHRNNNMHEFLCLLMWLLHGWMNKIKSIVIWFWPMLVCCIDESLVSMINMKNGLKESTCGYQNFRTYQILIFGGFVKVRVSLIRCSNYSLCQDHLEPYWD